MRVLLRPRLKISCNVRQHFRLAIREDLGLILAIAEAFKFQSLALYHRLATGVSL